MAAELSALVKNGAVRVLDLLILKKESDGSVEAFEAHDFGDSDLAELLELETELAMLLAATTSRRSPRRWSRGVSPPC